MPIPPTLQVISHEAGNCKVCRNVGKPTLNAAQYRKRETYIKLQSRRTKVKVKLTLLLKHHAMKTHGSEGTAPPLLTSALETGEWS
jgi:hypothetical protein